jgi:WhiB family redox-sensing transcriptional regulator
VALIAPSPADSMPEWRGDAACRDTNPDLFFPIGTTGGAIDQIEAAKEVCEQCDCKVDCLDFALTTNQDSGVWGGTAEEERRKIRRKWVADRRRTAS